MTSNFDTKNNNCYVSCDTTYQSCFDACNEDPGCEAGCLSDQSNCYDVCDSNPDNVIYAGNIHNFLWGGSLYEPETNLYWMRNRYYHKDMHRFINQDPIGIWGDANNLGNGFAYVAGMVIEASDPTGLDPKTAGSSRITQDLINAKWDIDLAIQTGANVGLGFEARMSLAVLGDSNVVAEIVSFIIDSVINDSDSSNKDTKDAGPKSVKFIDGYTNSNGNGTYTVFWSDNSFTTISFSNGGKDVTIIDYDKDTKRPVRVRFFEDGVLVEEWVWDQTLNNGKGGWKKIKGMPSDPDVSDDSFQQFLKDQILKKMMKNKNGNSNDDKEPIIHWKNEDGSIQFIHNPYYRQKDPTKRIIMGKTPNGPVITRNPIGPTEEELDAERARMEFMQRMKRLIYDDGKIDPVPMRGW